MCTRRHLSNTLLRLSEMGHARGKLSSVKNTEIELHIHLKLWKNWKAFDVRLFVLLLTATLC